MMFTTPFGRSVSSMIGRAGCVGGGLQDDGVAGRQRGADLPDGHHQGEVPGNDLTADAVGLPKHEVLGEPRKLLERQVLHVREGRAQIREGLKLEAAERKIAHGLPDGSTGVLGLERGELRRALSDPFADPEQDSRPLPRAHAEPGPLVEGPAGRGDGAAGILAAGLGHLRDRLLRGRIDGRECLTRLRIDELPVDVKLVAPHV
jgi:hypothetical protein